MSKIKIQLRFTNLHMLWDFAQSVQHASIEIHTSNKILTCYCSEAEINSAIEKFGAQVVQAPIREMNNTN